MGDTMGDERYMVLAHHGIKGMKWGIRRFQNEDGTLTAEGQKRYNQDGTKKSRQQRLEEQYRAAGKTQDQARALAQSKIRGERVAIALGAIAVTAAVAGAVHYRNKYVLDQYIPEDMPIKRITVDADPTHLHDRAFYATTKKRDQAKYVGLLGQLRQEQQMRFNGNNPLPVNEITIKTKGAKVASIKSGRDAYRELLRTNPEFAQLNRYSNYERFNRKGLISDNRNDRRMQDIFYKHLHDKGYDGVIDINDIKGGFKAKAPTIFFGGQVANGRDIIKSAEYRQVPLEEMAKANARERGILIARATMKSVATTPAFAIGATAAASAKVSGWVKKPVVEQQQREIREKRRAAAAAKRKAQNAQIKALAANSDYTIAEIAKRVGVSPSRVQKQLSGG